MLIIDDDFSHQILAGEPAIELRYSFGADRHVLSFLEGYLALVIGAWPRLAVGALPQDSVARRVLAWYEEWLELGPDVPLVLELDNALDFYVFVSRYGCASEGSPLPDPKGWYEKFLLALSRAATVEAGIVLVRV